MAGIASKNPFDLLDDNAADPDQAPKPAKADKPGVRGGKLAPAPSKPVSSQRDERPARGGDRGGRGGYRRGGGEGGGYRDRPPRQSEEGGEDYRGRGRGRGRPRGGRAREHRGNLDDRHSKSGVTDHEKQVAHGWGGNTGGAELADEQAGDALAKAEGEDGEGKPKVEGDANGDAGETGEPGEPEAKVKTLDDYLAEQAEKRLHVSGSLEARKANEGASKKWQQGTEFSRGEVEEEFIPGLGGKKTRERAKKEKQIVELDGDAMRPKDEPTERRGSRGGRGRGGSGRGEGGGYRGGYRGDGDRGDRGERHERGERGERGERHERGERGERGDHRGGHRGDYRGDRGGDRGGRGRGARGKTPNIADTSAFPSLGS